MIELVCLDMAGTTISDEGSVEAAFTAAMAGSGVPMDSALQYVRDTMGQSKIEVFTALFDGDRARAEVANAAFEEAYRSSIDNGAVSPIPGAADAIGSLRAAGVKVALTTGFSAATRDAILRAVGWQTGTIDLAVSPADAGRGRPHPDMILWALLHLGASSVDSVAVAGDTTSDLVAGTRAGASIVAGVLTGAHDRPTLESAPHTHILASVADLPGILDLGPPL